MTKGTRGKAIGVAAGLTAAAATSWWWVDHMMYVFLFLDSLILTGVAEVPRPIWGLLGLLTLVSLAIVAAEWIIKLATRRDAR